MQIVSPTSEIKKILATSGPFSCSFEIILWFHSNKMQYLEQLRIIVCEKFIQNLRKNYSLSISLLSRILQNIYVKRASKRHSFMDKLISNIFLLNINLPRLGFFMYIKGIIEGVYFPLRGNSFKVLVMSSN